MTCQAPGCPRAGEWAATFGRLRDMSMLIARLCGSCMREAAARGYILTPGQAFWFDEYVRAEL